MSAELKDRIEKMLASEHLANVAMVDGDRPHISALEYVSEGLDIYVVSIPGTRKNALLAKNPAVAIGVNGPGRKRDEITGLQYYGKATRVDDDALRERIKTLFFDKYLLEPAAHWQKDAMVYFVIQPERVDLIDYSKGFGHKESWTA